MLEVQESLLCSDCGTDLSQERWSAGVCPACLMALVLEDSSSGPKLQTDGSEPPLQTGTLLSEGEILGQRYRIRSLLGRGGMGEVWRAYDLKLHQDVALKALRGDLIQDRRALETLRQEVRTARGVVSPNVCRVFDLEELDGRELVAMEYVDGSTLREVLKERGPLALDEALEVASQLLAGLDAIHEASLIHRDIKPENVMITRTGRVVVMDFGIAKGLTEGEPGIVMGTPAYMSPEQAGGGALDPRADLFSAGVLLAEIVEPGGARSQEDRERLLEGLHRESPRVSATPWAKVIAKAAARDPEDRFRSAAALARALEAVTLRATGDETARPYPGLSPFHQEDAGFFYGRELEIEALWKKLRRPHLVAVIGPSGAGKSSFLRAGLLPTLTDRWQAVITTPGNRPFASLARALAERLPRDGATIDSLLRFEETDVAIELIQQWREGQRHALIILDQFEELFTQNSEETRHAFADLLGRLPLEADVHVLLAMRDDFLYHCHRYEALLPILSDLTLLGPPTGASLRRAIVQPALKCGYRFEDEAIIEEMLGEVEGERGSLSMVAFAAATLWDRRDRNRGLLTCEAYEEIGGVGGALAQHAESTLEEIGDDRIPIVRELLRNLVTSQGTRAARDRDELLSVFGSGQAAELVLDTLVDARLLTSYETPDGKDGDTPHHRIEIVHESLLAHWPRLVRWRTQDTEGAQLRDELRSQAKVWEEHGRSEDYLWTGTAFKEYQLWRERYSGGLTDAEEAFAAAMISLAARRRQRRRIAVTTVLTVLLIGLAVIAGFWHRAEQEGLRAEAGRLLALGELEIDSYPTAALAWATKSLEVFDTQEGRRLALRALQKAPPATVLPGSGSYDASGLVFSPSGERLAVVGWDKVSVLTEDGQKPIELVTYPNQFSPKSVAFPSEDLLVVERAGEFRWFSIPDGRAIRVESREDPIGSTCGQEGYLSWRLENGQESIYWWPFAQGAPRLVGTQPEALWGNDSECKSLAFARGDSVFVRSLEDWNQPPRMIGQHSADVAGLSFHPAGDRVAVRDEAGELRIWSLKGNPAQPLRTLRMGDMRAIMIRSQVGYGPTGRWLGLRGVEHGIPTVRLWDLHAPAAAEPLLLLKSDEGFSHRVTLHSNGRLIVSAYLGNAAFWPLPRRSRWVLSGFGRNPGDLQFSPDGKWIVLSEGDGVRAWPVEGQNEGKMRMVLDQRLIGFPGIAFDPSGEYVAAGTLSSVLLVPFQGGPIREMPAIPLSGQRRFGVMLDFSPNGRFLASTFGNSAAEDMVIRVWDLKTDEVQILGPVPGDTSILRFDDNRRLRWVGYVGNTPGGTGGERVFDLDDDSVEIVAEKGTVVDRILSSDGEFILESEFAGAALEDLEVLVTRKSLDGAETHRIITHSSPRRIALHPSGEWIVSGGYDGLVNVGPVSGKEPHLLLGHRGLIRAVAVSPDGRLIASVGDDRTVRLWPFPDMSKPPLHTLPREQLIADLHSRTNVRVVADPESPTGWKLDYAAFPGWAEIPEWP